MRPSGAASPLDLFEQPARFHQREIDSIAGRALKRLTDIVGAAREPVTHLI